MTSPPTGVSVVIVHYDDQEHLDLVLDALESQATDLDEIVVADDGSPTPPQLPDSAHLGAPIHLVGQQDLGFRAAAARNLGAARCSAGSDVLVFLDGDTIPGPGYVAALARAAREAGDQAVGPARGRGLAVGRRRHAEISGLNRAQVGRFLAETTDTTVDDRILEEPQWLAQGYDATDRLRDADERSYRFVISAVLAVTRPLWQAIGGFDESAVGYGGEDWELAHRAWNAGAQLRYEPDAVAWHDGPDAGGREVDLAEKTREILWLAERVPDRLTRDGRLLWEVPRVSVDLDDRGWPPETALLTCAALLAGGDVRIWRRGAQDLPWPAGDTRVHAGDEAGHVPDRIRAGTGYLVTVTEPVRPRTGTSLVDLCERGPARYPGLVVTTPRWLAEGRELPLGEPDAVEPMTTDRRLEAVWGGWAR